MVVTVITYVHAAVYGNDQAVKDKVVYDQHGQPFDYPEHKGLWKSRAITALIIVGIAAAMRVMWRVVTGQFDQILWALAEGVINLVGYAFVFAMLHRWKLNRLRSKPWYYMDDLDEGGNRYDEFWWKLRGWLALKAGSITLAEWQQLLDKGRAIPYEKQVAILAYVTEAFFAAAAFTIIMIH